MMKKGIVAATLICSLALATPLAASPLYGGYNGKSLFWIDSFFFGIDNEGRWWVRLPLDILAGRMRLIFKLESSGVLSAELVVFNTVGQADFLIGIDTDGLSWGESYQADFLAGTDSSGATWTEQSMYTFAGSGSDSSQNNWWFFTYDYQNLFSLTAGVNLTLLLQPPAGEEGDTTPAAGETSFSPLSILRREESIKLITLVKALSRNDRLLSRAKTFYRHSPDQAALLQFAADEVFSPTRRKRIEGILSDLIGAPSEF